MTVLGGLCRGRPRGPVVLVTFLLTLPLPSAAAASGTDPLRARQFGLELSGLADAAQAGGGAAGVVVAVIDTGVALAPPTSPAFSSPAGTSSTAILARTTRTATAPMSPG
ncbi:hypothetical protein [Streptomyces sp. SAS_260]|uniref:hypothetical protein n=1 Tax=Streptomyces sp. SAS_260 TaxID=3412751 RepID=UPI00403C69DB